jgi:outer membrane protein assembly factor BamD
MLLPARRSLICLILLGFIGAILCGCGSSSTIQNLTADQRFVQGKKNFDDGNYAEAITDFEIIKLQYPGSAVADKAQYYLAESRFKLGEYLLGAEEYQALRRNMPASPLAPGAQYKIGLCYYTLSPKSSLDQSYTTRAIDEFQTFLEYYPKHELVADAEAKIKELNTRLAEKKYNEAELYMKLESYRAAAVTFDNVIEKYHDTPYAEPALLEKVKALIARGKYEDAKPEIAKFLVKYPNSEHKGEAEALQHVIEEHLKTRSAAASPADSARK